MIDQTYHTHTSKDKDFMIQRLSHKLFCKEPVIRHILEIMNPPIAIQDGKVIMAIATVQRIRKEVLRMKIKNS